MEHGMNCPHHADKDEACTCALTERTMHAAWRKRAEEAEARIAALESQVKALTEERDAALKDFELLCSSDLVSRVNILREERDAQAEAVRVLGEAVYETAWQVTDEGCDVLHNVSPAVMTNPIARAAVEGGKRED